MKIKLEKTIWKCGDHWCGAAWTPKGIALLDFLRKRKSDVFARMSASGLSERETKDVPGFVTALQVQLERYFMGERIRFDVPLDLSGGTPFQQSVWRGAQKIAFGKSETYGSLAAKLGKPRATRAVGSALGANPVPIIVPCHRVLRSGGGLGGFSRGLDAKRKLLEIEGIPIKG
jgi:O-6-methylguanine DNA methyltransferase